MSSVKRGYGGERIWRDQRCANLPRNLRRQPAPRVNRCRDPGIRGAQNPAIIFDCPHPRLVQVLRVCAAIAVPAIVRNIYKNLSAIVGELAHIVGEDRFITDKNSQSRATSIEGNSRLPRTKFPYFLR